MNDRRSVTVSDDQNLRLQPRPVIYVWPHEVALRVVCHESVIGGVIGSNGSVISKFRDETGTKIHIVTPENDSDYRIVFIVGSTKIDKSILLTDKVGEFTGRKQEDWVTCNVSAAQTALIRVLERSWTVRAEKDNSDGEEEEAYCGILADRDQIGAVEMRGRETGAMVRVLTHPTCGTNNDVLIQITGDVLPVKKAVVMVSGCLQDCPPLNGYPLPLRIRAYGSSTDGNSEEPHFELFPNLRSLLPPISSDNALEATSSRHLSSVDAEGNSSHDSRDTNRKVVFRLICTNMEAGGIIGKKGVVIRALGNRTGAAIVVNAPFKRDEHLVTISAIENLELTYSPAKNALILAFARTVEMDISRGLVSGWHDGTTVKARLLVPSQFVNGFNVKNKELIATGAELHVSVGEQIKDWISEHQSTIEIKGNFKQVQMAMSHITSKLRDNLLSKELPNKVRARVSNPYEVARPSHTSNPQPSQNTTNGDSLSISHTQPSQENATRSDSLSISDGEHDVMIARTDTNLVKSNDYLMHTDGLKGDTARLPSLQENDLTQGIKQLQLSTNVDIISFPLRSKGISLKNITLELAIERNAFFLTLYDRNGTGLDNLHQITGAKVDVRDPTRREILVVISGTPDQTRAAMSWIVSILADQ